MKNIISFTLTFRVHDLIESDQIVPIPQICSPRLVAVAISRPALVIITPLPSSYY